MAYQALYRQWRPKVFEDIVGQIHITTTLKNQIKTGNVSHAYLFSGTRGTGKTSIAKIFARAVNCTELNNLNPCNKCNVCEGILSDSLMDVIEIDAASNNGVDHIRELRESVKYPPSKAKYKVYIIDEVHMLSGGAFNALLKTLEEPPKHVVFILATTEPQKLPATILSRCQRFDFRPVNYKAIVEHLKHICSSIGLSYEEKALGVVAANGNGSLRDSLSILEQCISYSSGELTYESVIICLGISSEEFLCRMVDSVIAKKANEALTLVQQALKEGKDIQQLIKDLIGYFHKLMLTKVENSLASEDISEGLKHILKNQANSIAINEIVDAIYALSEAESKAKYASQPQVILEVAVVGLCSKACESNEGLLERVIRLEKHLSSKKEIHPRGSSNEIQKEKPADKSDYNEDEFFEDIKEAVTDSTSYAEDTSASFSKIRDKWEETLEVMRRDKKAQIKAFLKEGDLVALNGRNLVVSFKDGFGFHREALDKEKTKEYIVSVIQQVTGLNVNIAFIMENEAVSNKKNVEDDVLELLKEAVPEGMLEILGD